MSIAIRPKLTHVGIDVIDIEAMAAFYKQTLRLIETDRGRGFTVPQDLVFLSSDSACHHQFVLSSGRRHEDRSTVNQLSFVVPTLDDLRSTYFHLRDCSVANLRCVTHGNAWSMYFEDPEGNRVEIYADTPWYVSQPHADPLDLTLSNEQILRVTEENCRKDPQFMSAIEWRARFNAAIESEDAHLSPRAHHEA